MNLFDIVTNAQGGKGVDALAGQFGLSRQQAEQAVEALLPAFSQGLKQNAADPYGFGAFLSALSSGQHARYFDDASQAFSPQGVAEGNGILGHLFGSKDLSRAVAEQASQATGIGQDVLKQMLPVVASMIMGGLFKQTNNQMAAGGLGQGNNPLGELIEQMMRQGGTGGAARPAPRQAPGGGDNPFGRMLEEMLGGGSSRQAPQRQGAPGDSPSGDNPLGDILGQILRGGRPQAEGGAEPGQAPQGRPGGNPLEDILGQILRGGQPQGQRPGSDRPAQPRQQRRPSNPLEDAFGPMVEPGRQMGEQYQKGVDNIFEQFRRGVERYR